MRPFQRRPSIDDETAEALIGGRPVGEHPGISGVLAAAASAPGEDELASAPVAAARLAALAASQTHNRRTIMMESLRRIRSRVPNVAVGVIAGLLVGGGAFAVAQTTGDGVHGGPKPRHHDAGDCNLANTAALQGNWTHGDYVSAVGKENPTRVRDAARSKCGKVIKGGGNQKNNQPANKPAKSPKLAKPSPAKSAPAPVKSSSSSPSPSESPEAPEASPSASPTDSPSPTAT